MYQAALWDSRQWCPCPGCSAALPCTPHIPVTHSGLLQVPQAAQSHQHGYPRTHGEHKLLKLPFAPLCPVASSTTSSTFHSSSVAPPGIHPPPRRAADSPWEQTHLPLLPWASPTFASAPATPSITALTGFEGDDTQRKWTTAAQCSQRRKRVAPKIQGFLCCTWNNS